MSEQTLKEKTAKGLFWGGVSNGLQQLFGIFFGVFLARILNDVDYGLIYMLGIFMGVAALIQDSGFTTALINKKTFQHDDYNAVFWFSLAAGTILYVLLFFSAPYIAEFYGYPELTNLARVQFLWFFFGSTATAHNAVLIKRLMVKERAKIDICALVASGVIGVWMAYIGMAYWGLAIQAVVNSGVGTILRWYYSPWRPTFTFNFRPLKEMYPFSVKLLITGFFGQINANVFSVILGKFYTKADTGNFSQGNKWMNMGSSFIWNMVNGVAQPVLAEVASDPRRQQQVFRKMLRFICFISFPAMLGLAFVSRELIIIGVTAKWLACVPIMQLLCIWGAFLPISNLYSQMIISKGKSDIYMYNTISVGIIQLVVVYAMIPYGIYYMVLASVMVNISWILVWHYIAWRLIKLRLFDAIKDSIPFLLITLVTLAITYLATKSIENNYMLFISRILIAAIIYILFMQLIKPTVYKESLEYMIKLRKR